MTWVGITLPNTFICNAKDKSQFFLKGVIMNKTKRGINRLLKKIIEVDDLISESATVGGIILHARFGNKRATIDSMGNILANVSISISENLKADLANVAQWVNSPITIAMEYRRCKGVLLPVI
jgi:hypothetical protein